MNEVVTKANNNKINSTIRVLSHCVHQRELTCVDAQNLCVKYIA